MSLSNNDGETISNGGNHNCSHNHSINGGPDTFKSFNNTVVSSPELE
jgi:hypothetical protein